MAYIHVEEVRAESERRDVRPRRDVERESASSNFTPQRIIDTVLLTHAFFLQFVHSRLA